MQINEAKEKIHWLGHDGFRIDAEKTIYIDPYQINPGKKADLLLITHSHSDHCSPADVSKIWKPDTIIVTEKDSAENLEGDIRIVAPGDALTIDDVKIEAVPAYNTNKDFHPKANGWLGFIVEFDGIRLYHAGDSDHIPEMSQFKVDIALLPVSGTYVMTANEAVDAALTMGPKLAIPMHIGTIVGSDLDAVTFKQALEGKIDVVILSKD